MGAQHAEGLLPSEDGNADAALHSMREQQLAGGEAGLRFQVLDDHGRLGPHREPVHEAGSHRDGHASDDLLLPRAHAGAEDHCALGRPRLHDDGMFDVQSPGDQRDGFVEDRLDPIAPQGREAELSHRILLPGPARPLLLGALPLGDVLEYDDGADDGLVVVPDGSGREPDGLAVTIVRLDVDQLVEACLPFDERAHRGPLLQLEPLACAMPEAFAFFVPFLAGVDLAAPDATQCRVGQQDVPCQIDDHDAHRERVEDQVEEALVRRDVRRPPGGRGSALMSPCRHVRS